MTTLARRTTRGTTKTEEKSEGRRGRRGSASRSATSASSGWGAYDDKRRNTGFNDKFKPPLDEEFLIKFMDDGPVAVYLQHWIDEAPKGEKKSYVCYKDGKGDPEEDEDCPLDAIGDTASTQTLFNVLNLGKAGDRRTPVVQTWHITAVTVADQVKRLSESKRSSPLNRENLYFIVKSTQGNRKIVWDIVPIKGDEIEEAGWDIKPFTAAELEKWSEDCIAEVSDFTHVDTREELLEVIEKYDLDG